MVENYRLRRPNLRVVRLFGKPRGSSPPFAPRTTSSFRFLDEEPDEDDDDPQWTIRQPAPSVAGNRRRPFRGFMDLSARPSLTAAQVQKSRHLKRLFLGRNRGVLRETQSHRWKS